MPSNSTLNKLCFVLVLAVVWFVIPQSVHALTDIFGPISSNTTWYTDEVYVVHGQVTINPSVVLTIEPGTVVKFYHEASLVVYGTLSANGTLGNEIYFTSFMDDTVGGDTNGDGSNTNPAMEDWARIALVEGGVMNLNHSVVRFGGTWPQYASIVQNGGVLKITNSIISDSLNGLKIYSGEATIEHNIIKDNHVGVGATGPGSLILNNNTFTNNSAGAAYVFFDLGKSFTSSDNTASGNGQNGIVVHGAINTNQTWSDQMPYIISNLMVPSGKTLTINAGTKVKFNYEGFMTVWGDLNVNGTADNRVYFTSIRDDSVGGDTNNDGFSGGNRADWGQITIAPGSIVNLNHAVVSFGGRNWPYYSNISLSGGSLLMSNSVISHSGSNGLRIYDGWADIYDSEISNNSTGIRVEGGGFAISNSSIYGNSGYGIYNGTWVEMNAENNWWGSPNGPYVFLLNPQGDRVSNFIDYDPWLDAPPTSSTPSTKEPVIIVPGILGSRLNRVSDGEEIWPNIGKMINPLTPEDNYLDELKLDNNGDEVIDINSTEIIESILSINQYGDLIQKFKDNGYELGLNLFVVPYDWRLDITISSHELDSAVAQAIGNSPTGKVNIIAHSMGGLLVKDYLVRKGDSEVNKLIFAGTPHLGAPKAFNLLNWGDDFDLRFLGLGLNRNKAKEIGQNMPAVYQLLPSREYLNNTSSYVEAGNNKLNYEQTNEFMMFDSLLFDHRNSDLLTRADDFHQLHDSWQPQSADVYNLLGCREYDTIGSFILDNDGAVDINSVTGDGTVPLISAEHIPGQNYYVLYPQTKINHMGLISDDRTIGLIYEIVTDSVSALPGGISGEERSCNNIVEEVKRLRFSTHSPVNLHVYDSFGNHTGLTSEGNIEMNIPDSNFVQVGNSSFIFVPDGTQYSIEIDAYATGSFDFKVKTLINGEVDEFVIFDDVPINNPDLDANFEFIGMDNVGTLNIDRDGNGTIDAGYLSDGGWIPLNATIQSTLDDLEQVYLLGWTSGEVKNSLKSLLMAMLPTETATKSRGRQADAVLGTAFLKQLEVEYNKGSINDRAYNIIKADIELLLQR